MIVRPWEKGDTVRVDLQEGQKYIPSLIDMNTDLSELSAIGHVFTFQEDDTILGVIGAEPMWSGRANTWTLLSKFCGKHFISIHKICAMIIDDLGYRRYEATVDIDFKAGHRWVKMLGFEPEGYMKAYRPDGEDMILYARVK
jgi:hypothetical protein